MKNKKLISFLVIFVVTLIVLYFSLKDDYYTIINTIFSIDKRWLLVAFLLLFSYYLLRSYVMYYFVKKFNTKITFKGIFRLTLETNFFHAVTPFSTGGQPYEIYSLNKNNIKVADALNVSIQNFIVYQIALVLLGIVSIICNNIFNLLNSSFLNHLITLGFIINFLVIFVLFWITLSKKKDRTIVDLLIEILGKIKLIKNPAKIKKQFHNYLSDFDNGSKALLENKFKFTILILIQLISLICLYLVPLALLVGVGVDSVGIFTCIITMSYVMLIGSFVPIPGGTGGLEYGFIALFGNFIKGSNLNAIMILWRFITYYFGMILGAIILNFKKELKK